MIGFVLFLVLALFYALKVTPMIWRNDPRFRPMSPENQPVPAAIYRGFLRGCLPCSVLMVIAAASVVVGNLVGGVAQAVCVIAGLLALPGMMVAALAAEKLRRPRSLIPPHLRSDELPYWKDSASTSTRR